MVRCSEIGKQAILSFHKHHPSYELNIFIGPEDLEHIPHDPRNKIHLLRNDNPIYTGFDSGHLGTSMLWQTILTERPSEIVVHFDADVYFTGNLVDDILKEMQTHDLVGSFRPYKLNPNNRDDVRGYPDAIQTYCFGVNTAKITERNPQTLQKMIRGYLWKHPVIDFFDPVTFHILENGGKIKYIDVNVIGGVDQMGHRENNYPGNKEYDWGSKIMHFAGVGSGRNFYNMLKEGKYIHVPKSYVEFGLQRYDYYSRVFLNKSILPTCNDDLNAVRKHIFGKGCGVHVMYINLDSRTDRKELVEEELAKVNCTFERVPAIPHTHGLIGCALSHIECLKLAKERGLPRVMIVEDDLQWIGDVNLALEKLKDQEFDVAVLSGVFDVAVKPIRVDDIFVRSVKSQTTAAYICQQNYYDTLIRNIEEGIHLMESGLHPDKCAIDQHWKVLQVRDNWVFALPTLGIQRPGYSDIQQKNVDYSSAFNRHH